MIVRLVLIALLAAADARAIVCLECCRIPTFHCRLGESGVRSSRRCGGRLIDPKEARCEHPAKHTCEFVVRFCPEIPIGFPGCATNFRLLLQRGSAVRFSYPETDLQPGYLAFFYCHPRRRTTSTE
jgi:hypothetical protein